MLDVCINCMYKIEMEYEWDKNKNELNIRTHGLDFYDAHLIFLKSHFTFVDDRYDYGEKRFVTIGSLNRRIVIVVHTMRNDKIRIISMRKANEREKKKFKNKLEKS